MPNGLTFKQEIFSREVVNGSNLTDAYILAYNTQNMKRQTIQRNAAALNSLPKIVERITQLEQQRDWHARLSEEFVLSELIQNHYRALDNNELNNSNRTLELLGRNLNLWKEQPKTDEQVQKLFAWLASPEANEPLPIEVKELAEPTDSETDAAPAAEEPAAP